MSKWPLFIIRSYMPFLEGKPIFYYSYYKINGEILVTAYKDIDQP